MAGIIVAEIDTGATSSIGQYYLDAPAELSKLERKNWTQTKRDGTPLVYDMLVTVTTDPSTTIEYSCYTAPNNWQTRNAVKMAKKLRDRLWKDSGVKPGMVGTYAKELRLNLDSNMHAIAYSPAVSGGDAVERIYAHSALRPAAAAIFAGGTWDYSELGTHLDAGFNLNRVWRSQRGGARTLHLCRLYRGLQSGTSNGSSGIAFDWRPGRYGFTIHAGGSTDRHSRRDFGPCRNLRRCATL